MVATQAAKTISMSEAWPDTYDEILDQFQPEPTHKIN